MCRLAPFVVTPRVTHGVALAKYVATDASYNSEALASAYVRERMARFFQDTDQHRCREGDMHWMTK
jgi:hypothetical protein